MDQDRFEEALRKLVDLGRDRGLVTLDDVETNLGSVGPDVFHDLLYELGDSGVVVEGVDDGDRASTPRPPVSLFPANDPGSPVLDSRQIYYRDVGRFPLLDRAGEVALARRRIALETRLARVLSRTVPVADAFLEALREVVDGRRRPDMVVLDPPRPTAPAGRGRPRSIGARIAAVTRARHDVVSALKVHALGGDGPSLALGRARVGLSRAVIAAKPVFAFWTDAAWRLNRTVERLLHLRDQAAVQNVLRTVGGARATRSAGVPIPVHYDDVRYLLWVRDQARGLRADINVVRRSFIESNLRLVSSMARRRRHSGGSGDVADLEQSGNFGLFRAVDRFDPDRGCKFSTYATWWIRQAISRDEHESAGDIRIPAHLVELSRRVRAWEGEFRMRHGRFPTVGEVADHVGSPPSEILRVRYAPSNIVSLEDPAGPDREGAAEVIGSRVPDPAAVDPEAAYRELQLQTACRRLMAELLTPEEEYVIRKRFGMPSRSDLALVPVSRAEERRLEVSALEKLRSEKGRGVLDGFVALRRRGAARVSRSGFPSEVALPSAVDVPSRSL